MNRTYIKRQLTLYKLGFDIDQDIKDIYEKFLRYIGTNEFKVEKRDDLRKDFIFYKVNGKMLSAYSPDVCSIIDENVIYINKMLLYSLVSSKEEREDLANKLVLGLMSYIMDIDISYFVIRVSEDRIDYILNR